jgi:hypothetical protein
MSDVREIPHTYQASTRGGCTTCGLGPGAAVHNAVFATVAPHPSHKWEKTPDPLLIERAHSYGKHQPIEQLAQCSECMTQSFEPGAESECPCATPQAAQPMHVFESGTKSSRVLPPLHLLPRAALNLLAERFRVGAIMRGEEWSHRKGVDDEAFFKDRINHMIDHALLYAESRKDEDLGAVMCNAAMLADILELRKSKEAKKA